MPDNDPIVIAGSGPAGSVLALHLAQRDIPVVLLEKERELPVDLRASTFHPPSLEMIATLGDQVLDKMLAKGLRVDRYQYRDRRSGEVAEFDMGLIADDTDYPFRLQLEQYELTRIVSEALKAYPCAEQRFSSRLCDFTPYEDCVQVEIETASGTESLNARFLIGADGASSQTRKSAGIGYGGFTYQEKFLVVSTDFPFEEVFDKLSWVNYISDPEEWCVILRTDKIWRVLFPTTAETADDHDLLLSDEHIQQRLNHLYPRDEAYRISHRSLYDVHQRVAETYVRGRVALVGDACHINNPLGGMGMNGGLHDAFNLADKLVEIVQANPAMQSDDEYQALFDRYDRQRRQLAVQFVQNHTIENKKLMEASEAELQQQRQRMLMDNANDPVKARAFILERAMINCLRDSLLVQ